MPASKASLKDVPFHQEEPAPSEFEEMAMVIVEMSAGVSKLVPLIMVIVGFK